MAGLPLRACGGCRYLSARIMTVGGEGKQARFGEGGRRGLSEGAGMKTPAFPTYAG